MEHHHSATVGYKVALSNSGIAMRWFRLVLLALALAAVAGCSSQIPEQPSFYRDISQGEALDAEAAASMISGYRKNNGPPKSRSIPS